MRNIRFQLEDLRILCDLVKRREKQKQKLIETRCEIFNKKVGMLSKSFDFKALNDSSIITINEKDEEEERMKEKSNFLIIFSQKETKEDDLIDLVQIYACYFIFLKFLE